MSTSDVPGRTTESWDRQPNFAAARDQHQLARRTTQESTIGWLPTLGGGLLAGVGLARGNMMLALLGGGIAYWGISKGVSALPQMPGRTHAPDGVSSIRVEHSVTINRPIDQVYAAWRDIERLPTIMSHLESVRDLGGGMSHWVAKGPLGRSVEWDAEIMNDEEAQVISWRSVADADVDNVGAVHFHEAPGGMGTEVRVRIEYNPPAGIVGATFARLFGEEPNKQVADDLRHFKAAMEAGEIPTTTGQPHAQTDSSLVGDRTTNLETQSRDI